MQEDFKLIHSSKSIFLSADKTQNVYEITMEDSEKTIHKNVTKRLICLYQKGLREKQKKLQQPLMSLIDLISWQNKSAL